MWRMTLRPIPPRALKIDDAATDQNMQQLVMCITCFNVSYMPTMIQIRNGPKSRAALAGMSLSDYLLNELREVAARPTAEELRARLQGRLRIMPSLAPTQAVRAERDRR